MGLWAHYAEFDADERFEEGSCADEFEAELDERLSELQAENCELCEKLRHSRDEDAIEAIARERLGLVMPGEIIFYFISDRED